MEFSIAIIDQGVDLAHERLKGCKFEGLNISEISPGAYQTGPEITDDTGHGTSIAAIIHKIAPVVPLYIIKLSSLKKKISEDLLCEGIDHALKQPGVRIINISMGLPADFPGERLHRLCQTAFEQNKLIVAAAHNFPDKACYPAHFSSVFGVSTGLVNAKLDYRYQDSPVNIFAKGSVQRVAFPGNQYKITSGTSFAAAHFSGFLGLLLREQPELDNFSVLKEVEKKSNNEVVPLLNVKQTKEPAYLNQDREEVDRQGKELFDLQGQLAFVNRVALFPVSEKEVNTLVENIDKIPYKVGALIDFPVKLKKVSGKLTIETKMLVNSDFEKIDFDSFDTLAVGYFLDQIVDHNLLFGIRLLRKCLSYDKNFIIWDKDVLNFINKQLCGHPGYAGKIFFVGIPEALGKTINNYAPLPHMTTPVMSIVGTSNKQGKITAQVRIKAILERAGYRVAHISTEPQGLLLGADFTFPYGHKSTVAIPEPEWSRFLKISLKGLQKYKPSDIVLTGIQGGLLPRARTLNDEYGNDLGSLHFLLGIQPDIVACAINPMDTIELISDTVGVIKSYCKPALLFYFMTPWIREFVPQSNGQRPFANWRLLDSDAYHNKLREYQKQLEAPVLDITAPGNDVLILDLIQKNLSQ